MRKRADGLYQKEIKITGADGEIIRKVIYAKTKADLEEKADKVKQKIERGIYTSKIKASEDTRIIG